jgi:hypothetical protein
VRAKTVQPRAASPGTRRRSPDQRRSRAVVCQLVSTARFGRKANTKEQRLLRKRGEPGGNRTHNPQIKSRSQACKTAQTRMILTASCAARGIATQRAATPAQPLRNRFRTSKSGLERFGRSDDLERSTLGRPSMTTSETRVRSRAQHPCRAGSPLRMRTFAWQHIVIKVADASSCPKGGGSGAAVCRRVVQLCRGTVERTVFEKG